MKRPHPTKSMSLIVNALNSADSTEKARHRHHHRHHHRDHPHRIAYIWEGAGSWSHLNEVELRLALLLDLPQCCQRPWLGQTRRQVCLFLWQIVYNDKGCQCSSRGGEKSRQCEVRHCFWGFVLVMPLFFGCSLVLSIAFVCRSSRRNERTPWKRECGVCWSNRFSERTKD